ncbi:MAG TPA: DUF2304 domain-containing protein [Phycisphaerae bacterium]|nr:DUF2304 domain-containing protein [Phycisphaerae bacterium]
MMWTQRIVLLVLGLGLLGLTLNLIRRRRLREEYAVLWVATSIVTLLFVLFSGALFDVATWLNLDHVVLMLLIVFVFLVAIMLHYSVVISRHSEREKGLSQEVALLKDELDKLRDEVRQPPPPPVEPKPKPPSLRT